MGLDQDTVTQHDGFGLKDHDPQSASDAWGGLEALPGHPLMWVLILSELVVFGAFLLTFSAARIGDPAGFANDQFYLDRVMGGINTLVLLTSGLFAVFAIRAIKKDAVLQCRVWLAGTAVLGIVFLIVKLIEYGSKIDAGIGLESSAFFTLYYLITGFHALHVVMGLGVLGVVAIWPNLTNIETGTAFWHMIDMVWVLVFPVIYLLR
ncbi:cytochrome c oxidase subunit 3 family protein [Thalassospira sp. MCCC 1A03138]|uniref:cytochrome c oxidase subunit 3 family protein n=1 Tax=Thalassospira sp. MCCC 1A03138 TaxID=1470576 RepID=UPI000A1F5DE2|nr:cytochrome c oxidase subunit 3 family protein [Thalassospira sp. MCCC 1A03138]